MAQSFLPRIGVIVVSWNQEALCLDALGSLSTLDYPSSCVDIILVDNGSTDNTIDSVSQAFPYVTILANQSNLGFADGNNQGIQEALACGAEYVFLLNNDAIIARDVLSELINATRRHTNAGILGPKVYHRERPNIIQSTGTKLDRLGGAYQRGLDEQDFGQYDTEEEVDAVVGCAMLVSRDVIDQVGMLDSRFFMYYEDTDWCWRARAASFKVVYIPKAVVWHREAAVRTADQARITYYMERNRYLLLSKQPGSRAARFRVFLQHLLWLTNWSINPKHLDKRDKRDALLKAMVDAVQGKYGRRSHHYGI